MAGTRSLLTLLKKLSLLVLGVAAGLLLSTVLRDGSLLHDGVGAGLNGGAGLLWRDVPYGQPRNNDQPDALPVKVLIAAYWRTGSGFMGELFNQNPEAFYLVEPLNGFIYPYMVFDSGKQAQDGVVPADFGVNTIDRQKEDLVSMLHNVLTCRIDALPQEMLAHTVMKLSKNLYQYNFCLGWNIFRTSQCRHILESACLDASIRAVKEVYVRADTIDLLLGQDPTLKVIHLIRDPRAILLSRHRRDIIPREHQPEAYAKELCDEMLRDLERIAILKQQHPGAFLNLYFEDFAEKPFEIAEQTYAFLGASKLPTDLRKWLTRSTASKTDDTRRDFFSSTRKRNSTATAYAWKYKLTFAQVQMIDQHCNDFYRATGYERILSEEQLWDRNLVHRSRSRKHIGM